MIQNILKVSAKGWKVLLKNHAGDIVILTAGGSAIYGILKVCNDVCREADKLRREGDKQIAEYKRKLEEIMEETHEKIKRRESFKETIDEIEKSNEETAHNIEQAKETKSELEELLRELDK